MSSDLEKLLDDQRREEAEANDTPVCIRLADGRLFDFRRPELHQWHHVTIAHHLSQLNRFTGATILPYNVAQHSVLVSYLLPEPLQFQGLMHDGHESVYGDMSSPLKSLCPDYRRLERQGAAAMRRFYGLPEVLDPLVKQADDRMFESERDGLMPPAAAGPIIGPQPEWRVKMSVWTPAESKARFIQRFEELYHP